MRMGNPVLMREMKTTFRTWKVFFSLAFYVLTLVLGAMLFLLVAVSNSYNGFNPKSILQLYFFMSGYQLFFIYMTVPAFTSGAISGERERQTLDLMLISKMSPYEIIIGKLMSSLMIVMLMIIASMPVYAIIFYYGGVTFYGFFITILFSIVNAMMIGSVSIFFSVLFKKNTIANAVAYLAIFFTSGFPFVLSSMIYYILYYKLNFYLPHWFYIIILGMNPILGFISIVDVQVGSSISWEIVGSFSSGYTNTNYFMPIWIVTVAFNIIFTIIFIKLSVNEIKPIKGK